MRKWEYDYAVLPENLFMQLDTLKSILNCRGKQGWELSALITVDNTRIYFYKRPLPRWWQFWKRKT